MQHYQLNIPATQTPSTMNGATSGRQYTGLSANFQDHAAEMTRLRQGIMHVRVRHFYCTLEESFDPSLRGIAFVVGTGTGRPNEPGRVIDASPAAQRLGVSPGMPLRRAYRIAPRVRFMPASYDRYQAVLHQLRERYRAYSRIVETIPMSDAYIDLRGCELPFNSPVSLAERLHRARHVHLHARRRSVCRSREWLPAPTDSLRQFVSVLPDGAIDQGLPRARLQQGCDR